MSTSEQQYNKFEGLVTTGEWIEFVEILGRVLSRNKNAASLSEIHNANSVKATAHGIAFFMQASDAEIDEAKSLVGRSVMEIEEHFLPRRRDEPIATIPLIQSTWYGRRSAGASFMRPVQLRYVKPGGICGINYVPFGKTTECNASELLAFSDPTFPGQMFAPCLLDKCIAPQWDECPAGTIAYRDAANYWSKSEDGAWYSNSDKQTRFAIPGDSVILVRLP